jgi:predicted site-specific integrase-resolvase
MMEKKLIKIGAAAALIGSTPATLRKWEETGELLPTRKTKGGTRYYSVAHLLALGDTDAPTVCYARVSSPDQKADLDRQCDMLETYSAAKGWRTQVICDLGSEINDRKQGLEQLLEMILRRQMRRLVVTHKDRLLRFGSELIFALCEIQGIEIIMIHTGDQPTVEEEFTRDVLEVITLFSARLDGTRSQKHHQLMADLQASADAIAEILDLSKVTIRART